MLSSGVDVGMAEQLLYGDETSIVDRRIVGDGAPLQIDSGTGISWGMIVRGAAHTRCVPIGGSSSMAEHDYVSASYR